MAKQDNLPATRQPNAPVLHIGPKTQGAVGGFGATVILVCLLAPVHVAGVVVGLILGTLLIVLAVFANRVEGEISMTKDGFKAYVAGIAKRSDAEIEQGKVLDIENVWPEIDPIVPAGSTPPAGPNDADFSKVRPHTKIELTDSARDELRNFFSDDARAILEGLLRIPEALQTTDGVRLIEQPSSVAYYTYSPVAGVQVLFRQRPKRGSDETTTYIVMSVLPL